jgi:hypothetical protein
MVLTGSASFTPFRGPVHRNSLGFARLNTIRRLHEDGTRCPLPNLNCGFIGFEWECLCRYIGGGGVASERGWLKDKKERGRGVARKL